MSLQIVLWWYKICQQCFDVFWVEWTSGGFDFLPLNTLFNKYSPRHQRLSKLQRDHSKAVSNCSLVVMSSCPYINASIRHSTHYDHISTVKRNVDVATNNLIWSPSVAFCLYLWQEISNKIKRLPHSSMHCRQQDLIRTHTAISFLSRHLIQNWIGNISNILHRVFRILPC